MLSRSHIHALAFCAALISGEASCLAEDVYTLETYASIDYSGNAGGIASTTVWSFLGPIDQPGFRLKLDSFASLQGQSNADISSSTFLDDMFADVMAGYQFHWDQFWIKVYCGGAYQEQAQVFGISGQTPTLKGYGAVAAVEAYWRGDGRFWASMNASWRQFDSTVSLYDRLAYEVVSDYEGLKVSVGAETYRMVGLGPSLDGEEGFAKVGALLNLRYFSHDLSLSAGEEEVNADGVWRPYATLSYGKKF